MNVEAEKAAIESMIANWLEATNQGGEKAADGYVSFVTEDAVFLPPHATRAEGRGISAMSRYKATICIMTAGACIMGICGTAYQRIIMTTGTA